MNQSDLVEICLLAHVDPAYYSVGSETHEALCLVREKDGWKVFLSERGDRYEEQEFADEDNACVYFLKRLLRLWREA